MKASKLLAAIFLTAFAGLSVQNAAYADSKDGVFPSADQVGGQVYTEPIGAGTKFPTNFDVFDADGHKVDLASEIGGKRTMVVFFISAAPASVSELKNLQDYVTSNKKKIQILNVNADTVGVALEGGPSKAVAATVRTMKIIQREHGLTNPMLVAPNDALSPTGLSNRLGFRGLPTMFLLDSKGVIEKVFVGPQQWKRDDIS